MSRFLTTASSLAHHTSPSRICMHLTASQSTRAHWKTSINAFTRNPVFELYLYNDVLVEDWNTDFIFLQLLGSNICYLQGKDATWCTVSCMGSSTAWIQFFLSQYSSRMDFMIKCVVHGTHMQRTAWLTLCTLCPRGLCASPIANISSHASKVVCMWPFMWLSPCPSAPLCPATLPL